MIKYLPELLKENVISQDVADNISNYYLKKKKQGLNKLFLIFGILGALLVGLGVILIIAHNWDQLPRNIKTIFAFLPLIVAQFLCGYTLLKKNDSIVWKESTATFLFLAIGACISLISQVYHISGNLSLFLLTWMSLSLPIIYLMNSSFASLLYIIGITYYSCECSYWSYPSSEPYFYWVLILLVIPHYVMLVKHKPESNFVRFHNLLIALSVIISLGTLSKDNSELMYIPYFSLFGILLVIDKLPFFQKHNMQDRSFAILGFTGTLVMLFMLSFDWYWRHLAKPHHHIDQMFLSQEMLASVIITLLALFLLFKRYRSQSIDRNSPIEFVFLLFIIAYLTCGSMPFVAILLMNATLLFLGISTIVNGLKSNHLGILNLGLLIIAVLIVCRFFDTDLSFLTRGILFIAAGAGFFVTNYQMLKNRRNNEN